MSKVTAQQVVDALSGSYLLADGVDADALIAKLQTQLAIRIEEHGIAPPYGWVSLESVLNAIPKLNPPESRDSIEYRERYEQFTKDMNWVKERITALLPSTTDNTP